jgi:hypothetical protein
MPVAAKTYSTVSIRRLNIEGAGAIMAASNLNEFRAELYDIT